MQCYRRLLNLPAKNGRHPMNILVANLGSTSVKYRLLEMPAEKVLASGKLERVADYSEAIAQIQNLPEPVEAVAFKTVHGGPNYRGTHLIDEGLLSALEEYEMAAPLHNRIYIDGIRAFQKAMPGTPLVAAFETEFHRTRLDHNARYGIPSEWTEKYGIFRYGFHGASHQWVSERAASLLNTGPSSLRVVSCHLGGSSSVCAIRGGLSIDCSMGFSPQSGLENATRHGDLDAYALIYLQRKLDISVDEIERRLLREGGLAGLSGIEGGDMRDIVQAAESGDTDASRAFDQFTYQVKKYIGAYAAAMEGVDVVAFTGGIGENRFRVRSMVCLGLAFLGIEIDESLNVMEGGDRVISTPSSNAKVLVIEANEELIVARRASLVLG